MPLLFSYGTLQQEEVQLSTFGRLLQGQCDELPRFEASLVRTEDPDAAAAAGRTHHANVMFNGSNDSRVRGTVFEVTEAELAAADRYERPYYGPLALRSCQVAAVSRRRMGEWDMTEEGRCVFVASGEMHAEQVRAFLKSAGIATTVRGEALRHTHGLTLDGLGAVEIIVSEGDEPAARTLLESAEAGLFRLPDDASTEG